MRCLLIYDIPSDRIRTRVASACLDYGLERLQKSAFGGQLTSAHQRELLAVIRKRVGKRACSVHLYPLDETTWFARRTIEQTEPG